MSLSKGTGTGTSTMARGRSLERDERGQGGTWRERRRARNVQRLSNVDQTLGQLCGKCSTGRQAVKAVQQRIWFGGQGAGGGRAHRLDANAPSRGGIHRLRRRGGRTWCLVMPWSCSRRCCTHTARSQRSSSWPDRTSARMWKNFNRICLDLWRKAVVDAI